MVQRLGELNESLEFRTKRLPLRLLVLSCAKVMHETKPPRRPKAMTVYGYARVSTDGQPLTAQDATLRAAGCAKIFAEKASGAKTDRKALGRAIAVLGEGDVLVVTRLD